MLTQEKANKRFEELGIKLIGSFKGFNNYSECICPICNTTKMICLRRALKSKKCEECSAKNNPLKEKLNPIKVRKYIESLGFQLIDEYTKSKIPLNLICSCGSPWKCTLDNIKKGKKCKKCAYHYGQDHHMWKPDRQQLMEDRKFKKACYTMVTRSMNRKTNKNHTEELLRYTSEQLQNHIKNHSDYPKILKSNERLAIDHIIPLQAFKDHNMLNEDCVWLINHLDNLRPTIMSWNSSKNSKYNIEDFNNYLTIHGVEPPNIKNN